MRTRARCRTDLLTGKLWRKFKRAIHSFDTGPKVRPARLVRAESRAASLDAPTVNAGITPLLEHEKARARAPRRQCELCRRGFAFCNQASLAKRRPPRGTPPSMFRAPEAGSFTPFYSITNLDTTQTHRKLLRSRTHVWRIADQPSPRESLARPENGHCCDCMPGCIKYRC